MVIERYQIFMPLRMQRFIWRLGVCAIDKGMAKILLHKANPPWLKNRSSKNCHVLLVGKLPFVLKECEMPHLVHIQQNSIPVVFAYGTALANRRDLRNGLVVAELGREC